MPVTLQGDDLVFSFPDHAGAELRVRLSHAAAEVDDLLDARDEWIEAGGIVLDLDSPTGTDEVKLDLRVSGGPVAMKWGSRLSGGDKHDNTTGEPWSVVLQRDPQNYLALHPGHAGGPSCGVRHGDVEAFQLLVYPARPGADTGSGGTGPSDTRDDGDLAAWDQRAGCKCVVWLNPTVVAPAKEPPPPPDERPHGGGLEGLLGRIVDDVASVIDHPDRVGRAFKDLDDPAKQRELQRKVEERARDVLNTLGDLLRDTERKDR